MLGQAWIALNALVIAAAAAVGGTWVVRERWDTGQTTSVTVAFAILGVAATLSYLWLRRSNASDIRRRTWIALRTEFVFLGAAAVAFAVSDATSLFAENPSVPGEAAQVVRVVDGDTIRVILSGQEFRVRYIGMDTPELDHPTRGEDPFAREATERNRRLVEGTTVWLEKDVSETDQYDRLLRYVWLKDGRMVNMALVEEGFATAFTVPPDVKHTDDFLRLEREAREAKRGMWSLP